MANKINMPLSWLPLALAIALLVGCSSHYSTKDVAGKYALSVNGAVDTVELERNGTYTHTCVAKDGLTDRQGGTWTLEYLQAGPTVVLNDFHPLLSETVRGQGTYLLLVKKSFGGLYLITNIDLDEGYKKQP